MTLEINGREERHQEITFVNEKGSLQPVFSVSLLEALGVNVGAIPAFSRLQEGETFTHLEDFIPVARTSYDFNQQRLFSQPAAGGDENTAAVATCRSRSGTMVSRRHLLITVCRAVRPVIRAG